MIAVQHRSRRPVGHVNRVTALLTPSPLDAAAQCLMELLPPKGSARTKDVVMDLKADGHRVRNLADLDAIIAVIGKRNVRVEREGDGRTGQVRFHPDDAAAGQALAQRF